MARAIGLFHATLPVWDLERSEKFWRDLLGIQRSAAPSYRPSTVVFLDLGNTMIHLVRYDDDIPRPDPRSTHIAIEVDDLDDAASAVVRAGLKVLGDITTRFDGSRALYFIDIDGNRVELLQRKP